MRSVRKGTEPTAQAIFAQTNPIDPILHLVKAGGKLIEEPAALARLLRAFAALAGPKVLVHGGGRSATRFAERLNLPTRLVDGRRLTDAATLEVVVMVYAGLTNKRIVAQLQALDVDALGLSGADANLIAAHKRTGGDLDYGYVGDLDAVNAERLRQLLTQGLTPVLCPITHDGRGQLLNTNADTIAARVAVALSAHYRVRLHYCFEYPGVLYDLDEPTRTMPEIRVSDLPSLRDSGAVHAGMLPKLDNAAFAKTRGVAAVSICGVDNLATQTGATWISA